MHFSEFSRPEWRMLSQVSRPSRYAGSEWRPYSLADWDTAKLRVCLAFLNVYEKALMRQHDMHLLSTEQKRPVRDFDVIALGLVASVATEGVNNHAF